MDAFDWPYVGMIGYVVVLTLGAWIVGRRS
jgi:hypothetical protein